MAIPARGVRDIRTHSGQVDQVTEPYRAFMKISCLEMERARRQKESDSATCRLALLQQRFQEIEAEKDALLRTLGERAGARAAAAAAPRSAPRGSTGAFRIRY